MSKRVGNAQTIADLEFVIDASTAGDRRSAWTTFGVTCTRDRHRYSGQSYEFNIEIVDVRHGNGGRNEWQLHH